MLSVVTFKAIGGVIVDQSLELQYGLDTFYFLVCGALVMWMAAGFAMLEAGLVCSKKHRSNTDEKRGAFCHLLLHVSRLRIRHYVRWGNLPKRHRA